MGSATRGLVFVALGGSERRVTKNTVPITATIKVIALQERASATSDTPEQIAAPTPNTIAM
jgi:hypothetical protein